MPPPSDDDVATDPRRLARARIWHGIGAAVVGWQLGFWPVVHYAGKATGDCVADSCGGSEGLLLLLSAAAAATLSAPFTMACALAAVRVRCVLLAAGIAAAASTLLVPTAILTAELLQIVAILGARPPEAVSLAAFAIAASAVPILATTVTKVATEHRR
jgi:hypothetical protein